MKEAASGSLHIALSSAQGGMFAIPPLLPLLLFPLSLLLLSPSAVLLPSAKILAPPLLVAVPPLASPPPAEGEGENEDESERESESKSEDKSKSNSDRTSIARSTGRVKSDGQELVGFHAIPDVQSVQHVLLQVLRDEAERGPDPALVFESVCLDVVGCVGVWWDVRELVMRYEMRRRRRTRSSPVEDVWMFVCVMECGGVWWSV
jgi:hypothetical protein